MLMLDRSMCGAKEWLNQLVDRESPKISFFSVFRADQSLECQILYPMHLLSFKLQITFYRLN